MRKSITEIKKHGKAKSSSNVLIPRINTGNKFKEGPSIHLGLATIDIQGKESSLRDFEVSNTKSKGAAINANCKSLYMSEAPLKKSKSRKENTAESSTKFAPNKTFHRLPQCVNEESEVQTERSVSRTRTAAQVKRNKSQSKLECKSRNDSKTMATSRCTTKRIKDMKEKAKAQCQKKQEELDKSKRNVRKNDLLRNKLGRELDKLLEAHNPLGLGINLGMFCKRLANCR
eukprot:TRINITY_DN7814_c0_g1_i12.p1 TRINITY_DN7814_c0_g1~~TRINITY_DN7814_c0_g1_i12.p1  ORF type:complete len:230 (-),score=40.27 TRINITY_DN7814_c0_g1_i12:346-1035(-)